MERQILALEQESGHDLSFPWGPGKALSFIVLCHKKGLKGSTISVYTRRVKVMRRPSVEVNNYDN